jgi:hypothetical protein
MQTYLGSRFRRLHRHYHSLQKAVLRTVSEGINKSGLLAQVEPVRASQSIRIGQYQMWRKQACVKKCPSRNESSGMLTRNTGVEFQKLQVT